MTNSLNAGGQEKVSRGAKLMNFISGSRLKFTGTARLQIPVGAKPSTCTVGELWSDSADGNKLYQCTATDTWTKVGTQA
jgi:hypothetical protein